MKQKNTAEIIEALTSAVESKYRGDPTSAGLHVAKLYGGDYWCSVVRYTERFGEGKVLVVGIRGNKCIRESVIKCARAWLKIVDTASPFADLRSALGESV